MGNQIPGRIHRTRDCENSCKARLPRPLLSERGLLASSHFHVFIIVSLSHSAKLRHPTGAVCVCRKLDKGKCTSNFSTDKESGGRFLRRATSLSCTCFQHARCLQIVSKRKRVEQKQAGPICKTLIIAETS